MPGMKKPPTQSIVVREPTEKSLLACLNSQKLYACNGVDDKGEAGQRMGLTLILQDDIQF